MTAAVDEKGQVDGEEEEKKKKRRRRKKKTRAEKRMAKEKRAEKELTMQKTRRLRWRRMVFLCWAFGFFSLFLFFFCWPSCLAVSWRILAG